MKHLILASAAIGISSLFAACTPSGNLNNLTPMASPTPPVKTASISGTIKVNGAVAQNSSVLMLQREAGATEYQEFDRLPPVSGTNWIWTKAIAGQKYDITAAGQVNEQNKVVANAVSVTAPAEGIVLTLNTQLSLPEPTEKPVLLTCGNPDSTNHYNAKLSFPPVKNAKQYYATVGTSPDKDDVTTKLLPAKTNEAVEMTAYVAKDTDYFTRYAYTYCTDCNQKDTQNWSGYSPTLGFKCQ